MEPTRYLVGVLIELPPRMERRHRELHAGYTLFRVYIDGDPPAIVADRDRAVLTQRDPYFGAEAGHRLVDGVVDNFVHEVCNPRRTSIRCTFRVASERPPAP